MLYDYYCKALDKSSEYIGHKPVLRASVPTAKYADTCAGWAARTTVRSAAVNKAGVRACADLRRVAGSSGRIPAEVRGTRSRPCAASEAFRAVIEALAQQIRLLFHPAFGSKNGGHIGRRLRLKKQDGDLWLRINDPTNPPPRSPPEAESAADPEESLVLFRVLGRAARRSSRTPKTRGTSPHYMELDKSGATFRARPEGR